MKKPELVVFGAGSEDLRAAASRLAEQATSFGWFHQVHLFDEKCLGSSYYDTFFKINVQRDKGFGYWSWKPFLINLLYKRLGPGETLLYLDAGCELNRFGEKLFNDYVSRSHSKNVTLFHLPHLSRHWTKKHPLLDFELFLEDRFQVTAAVLFFTKSPTTTRLIERWLELSSYEGGILLTDPTPNEPQRPGFQQHRHDQSLLSWAVYEAAIPTIPDETYFEDWRQGITKPILTLRNKTGEPRLEFLLRPRWQRKLLRLFGKEPGRR